MISNKFDKDKYDALNVVYEKTLGKITPNIFSYNRFLIDSGFEPWSNTYCEMFFYYFDTRPLFKGINLLFCDEYSNLYAINIIEKFGLNLFDATKKHVNYMDEKFLETIPTLDKVGFLYVNQSHLYQYFIDKYKEETSKEVLVAGFGEDWFNPAPLVYDYEEAAEIVPVNAGEEQVNMGGIIDYEEPFGNVDSNIIYDNDGYIGSPSNRMKHMMDRYGHMGYNNRFGMINEMRNDGFCDYEIERFLYNC